MATLESMSMPKERLLYNACLMFPSYENATSAKAIFGGGSFGLSSNLNEIFGGLVGSWMSPSASILSMIFCLDLAWRTRFA